LLFKIKADLFCKYVKLNITISNSNSEGNFKGKLEGKITKKDEDRYYSPDYV
jgi:hypothetical protein